MIRSIELDPEFVKELLESEPLSIIESLSEVQPMENYVGEIFRWNQKTEEQLRSEGYEPISSLGLMWRKKDARPQSK